MRRLLCGIFVQWQSEHGSHALDAVVGTLWSNWNAEYTLPELASHINMMVESGSRYRNIDKHLGFGACFMLGKDLPESW